MAPWASHSSVSASGSTGRPSSTCDSSTGCSARSSTRSNASARPRGVESRATRVRVSRPEPRRRCPRPGGQCHDLDGRVRRLAQLPNQIFRPRFEADQADALLVEALLQPRRHHAAVPRPPVDRDDAAARQQAAVALGRLVQHLVGDRVIDLPRPAEAAGGRREQHQRPQLLRRQRRQDVAQPGDLRSVNAVELFLRFVRDEGVGQHAGAVDQAAHRTMVRADPAQHVGGRRGVAHVHRVVHRLRARRCDALQGARASRAGP